MITRPRVPSRETERSRGTRPVRRSLAIKKLRVGPAFAVQSTFRVSRLDERVERLVATESRRGGAFDSNFRGSLEGWNRWRRSARQEYPPVGAENVRELKRDPISQAIECSDCHLSNGWPRAFYKRTVKCANRRSGPPLHFNQIISLLRGSATLKEILARPKGLISFSSFFFSFRFGIAPPSAPFLPRAP